MLRFLCAYFLYISFEVYHRHYLERYHVICKKNKTTCSRFIPEVTLFVLFWIVVETLMRFQRKHVIFLRPFRSHRFSVSKCSLSKITNETLTRFQMLRPKCNSFSVLNFTLKAQRQIGQII